MTGQYVQVEGLDELIRGFRKADREIARELSGELRVIARGVAAKAREIADAKGLHETGTLIRKITISVRGSSAYVRDTAVRVSPKWPTGFRYPAVYEFGKGGQRAFLHPAVEESEPMILNGIESMLDRLLTESF